MTAVRRRVYLMRHGDVAYFDADGRPVPPDDVPLTETGRAQARAAGAALEGEALDRVVTSGLRRTVETAALVAPGLEPEIVPELRELRSGRLEDLPEGEVEDAFVGFFDGAVPEPRRFLGGETIGELLDRVNPAFDAIVAEKDWNTLLMVLHGGVNRAILSRALTGERVFLGGFEQAPGCVNVLDLGPGGWIVRAVNVAPSDPVHRAGWETTMELLWAQYRRAASP
ncbi:MAG: histidine phosphatase family protein [Gaiellaceae bacterium]